MIGIPESDPLDAWVNEGGSPDASPPVPLLNVLIIEDDAMIAMLYSELIHQIGHQVCGTASTENEAVAMAGSLLPDLIITDLGLGQGSGRAAIQRILRSRDVPFLVVTGTGIEALPGADSARLLRKPFSEEQLIGAIAFAIRGSVHHASHAS